MFLLALKFWFFKSISFVSLVFSFNYLVYSSYFSPLKIYVYDKLWLEIRVVSPIILFYYFISFFLAVAWLILGEQKRKFKACANYVVIFTSFLWIWYMLFFWGLVRSRICVKNLPKYTTEDRLREFFSQKGEVTDVKLARTRYFVTGFRILCNYLGLFL